MTHYRTILAIDHDRHAVETYRANAAAGLIACDPAAVLCGDVTDAIRDMRMGMADVILGGPPCQPYSTAGKMLGDKDGRDQVPWFCRAVEVVQPRMFLMEQVAAFAMAKKFQAVLQRTVERLERAGYKVQMKILNAVDYGVPQFRRRCWFWGVRTDLAEVIRRVRWPKETHADPGTMRQPCVFGGDLQPWVTVGDALGLNATMDEGGIDYRWSDAMLAMHPPAEPDKPSPTVKANWCKAGAEGLVAVRDRLSADGRTWDSRHPIAESGSPSPTVRARSPRDGGRNVEAVVRDGLLVRRLTWAECARLQSMPDGFIWPASVPKTARYRIIGNGWASLMARRMSEALAAADPESRTVIDLFCGGGVGAVGWHRRAWESVCTRTAHERGGKSARLTCQVDVV